MIDALGAEGIGLRRTAAQAERLDDARWLRCADDIKTAYVLRANVTLLVTTTRNVLATSGIVRPRVLLPADARAWPVDRIRAVLCHEFAHICRSDWAVQVAAEILCAIFWFSPLMWMACTRLRRESEQACDDVVLGAGAVRPPDYAAHLLELARSCRTPGRLSPAMTMARRSTLQRRIAAMLNRGIDHRPLSPRRAAAIAALVFALAVPIVVVHARQAGPSPLTGTTYDATGGVLPGVALTLRDVNGIEQTATSDAAGQFEFPAVAAGRYARSLPGFRG